ncbi:PAS domain S-box protein [Methanolobus profundi]|uniref:histidine kinase n=1 Tax=Methanolobus profundi TaxID=487685 RepID=A0A1I4TSK7_9EURY|nr:PAS domain S-box protein [Methanolobus profundi]SFM79651.1 PAS domain S-box-containing protein [Methanolobus profundi]
MRTASSQATFDSVVVQNAPIGICIFDRNDNLTLLNRSMAAILGVAEKDMVGKDPFRDIPAFMREDDQGLGQLYVDTKKSLRSSFKSRMSVTTPAGKHIFISVHMVPIFSEDGDHEGIIAYVEEVSEHYYKEKVLIDEIYKFRDLESIYRNIPFIAFRWSGQEGWPVQYVSDNISQLGYNKDDFLSGDLRYIDIVHPDDVGKLVSEVDAFERTDQIYFSDDYRLVSKEGDVIWVNEISLLTEDGEEAPFRYDGIIFDITDRKMKEKELERSKAHIESIFRATPVGIGVASNRIFVEVNDKLCEMLGYSRGELIGQSSRMIYPDDRSYEYVGAEKYSLINETGIGVVETRMVCKGGEVIDVILSSTPIDSESLSEGVTFAVLDITHLKDTERELQKRTEELEQLNSLKDLFSDIIRHDLLNPASAIDAYAQLLEEMETDERKLYFLNKITGSNADLMSLLESASRYEKLNSIEEVDFEKMDLASLFKIAITGLSREMECKGVTVDLSSEGPCYSYVNPFVTEVFVNLLSNAIKYGPENGVISADIIDEGTVWKVAVTDQGSGIDDTDKPFLFERFRRADKKGIKGTGLGLAIVKRIMELHSGDYGVADDPEGKGSVFWVTFNKVDVKE